MAVNLINSNDIEISQNGDDIKLNTTIDLQTMRDDIDINTSDITDIKNSKLYSLSEVDTGEKWIDGKSIYKKVVSVGARSTTNTDIWVAHGISNLEQIIDIGGFYNISIGTVAVNFHNKSATDYSFFTYVNTTSHSGNIGIRIGTAITGGYVILKYTKSS